MSALDYSPMVVRMYAKQADEAWQNGDAREASFALGFVADQIKAFFAAVEGDTLNFSTLGKDAQKVCERAGISTVDDLILRTRDEMMLNIKGCGPWVLGRLKRYAAVASHAKRQRARD